MTPAAVFALVGHSSTALICLTITAIVVLQLRHDVKSRAFASLTAVMAAIAICGLFIRFASLLGDDGIFELFTLAGALTGTMPALLFIFTAEYLNAWNHWRRWVARLLVAALAVGVILGLFGKLIRDIHLSPDGLLTYAAEPAAVFLLGIGELGVLLSLQIVVEAYRKHQAGLNVRFLVGIGLISIGLLLILIPDLGKYTLEQKLYAVGSVILLGPVIRQRLFNPLAELNTRLAHQAEQFKTLTTVGQQTTSLLHLDALLTAAVTEIQMALGYETVAIFLPDSQDREHFIARAAAGVRAEALLHTEPGRVIRRCELESLLHSPLQTGVTSPTNKTTMRYFLLTVGSPAAAEQQVGLLGIEGRQMEALTPEDQEVIHILTRQIGIAIHNAMLFEKVQQARQQADEANRHKTQFLSVMSHELRSPLQTIITHSQWLLKNPANPGEVSLPDTYMADAASIAKAGKHLRQLIDNILDLSKIEAGEYELLIEPVDPVPILKDVQDTYIHSLADGVVFHAAYPSSLPLILADDLCLKQILGNLVSNACKFCQHGQITLDATVQQHVLCFSVTDTGPGIPHDAQPFVFNRYKQANRLVTHEYGGTGLGLSIAQQLVHLHAGEIDFRSMEGVGSTFFFTMPLASPDVPSASNGSKNHHVPRVTFFDRRLRDTPQQVLIINPVPNSSNLLEQALLQLELRPIVVDTAFQGIRWATALLPACAIIVVPPHSPPEIHRLAPLLKRNEALAHTLILEEHLDRPNWIPQLSATLIQSLQLPRSATVRAERTEHNG